ncbi:unnamed protein product, partial [Polarella glacialis]
MTCFTFAVMSPRALSVRVQLCFPYFRGIFSMCSPFVVVVVVVSILLSEQFLHRVVSALPFQRSLRFPGRSVFLRVSQALLFGFVLDILMMTCVLGVLFTLLFAFVGTVVLDILLVTCGFEVLYQTLLIAFVALLVLDIFVVTCGFEVLYQKFAFVVTLVQDIFVGTCGFEVLYQTLLLL